MKATNIIYPPPQTHTLTHHTPQSDEEVALGLQGTIFMDRNHPEKLPAIQLSFIQNLVSPLFHAAAEARIIPGITEAATPVQPTISISEPTASDEQGTMNGGYTNGIVPNNAHWWKFIKIY